MQDENGPNPEQKTPVAGGATRWRQATDVTVVGRQLRARRWRTSIRVNDGGKTGLGWDYWFCLLGSERPRNRSVDFLLAGCFGLLKEKTETAANVACTFAQNAGASVRDTDDIVAISIVFTGDTPSGFVPSGPRYIHPHSSWDFFSNRGTSPQLFGPGQLKFFFLAARTPTRPSPPKHIHAPFNRNKHRGKGNVLDPSRSGVGLVACER